MAKYFKELISGDESAKIVADGQNVILDGGTGTGKSSWAIDVLSRYAHRVLYLVPRIKLKQDIEYTVHNKQVKNINVRTYQSVEFKIREKYSDYSIAEDAIIDDWLGMYDAVVFDEVHCIVSDSSYNQFTEYIYNLMMKLLQTKIAVIMMSATGDVIFNNLKDRYVDAGHIYSIETDYSYLYCTPVKSSSNGIYNTIKELIRTSTPEEKIIFFCGSKNRGIDCYYEFKQMCDTTFACSKYAEKGREININNIDSVTDTFSGKLLITTTALDVGINLTDTNIRYIITDIYDIDTIIQCLGRRRVKPKEKRENGEGDPVYLYFRNWNKGSIQFIKRDVDEKLRQIDLFKNDIDEFNKIYFKKDTERPNCIYYNNCKLNLNEVGEIRLMDDSNKMREISDYTLKNILSSRLTGAKVYETEDYEEKHETIRSYVLSKLNAYLDATEREMLIDIIDLRDKRKRKQRSFKMIATYLEEHCQVNLEAERIQNGGARETYWVIKPTENTYDFIDKYYRR